MAFSRFEDFEAAALGQLWMLRAAGFSGSTRGIVTGSSSSAAVNTESNPILDLRVGAPGVQSQRLAWTWADPLADDAMARCTSYSTAANSINRPNPLLDLSRGLSFYLRVAKGSVDMSLWIRETGTAGEIGSDGGITGTIEESANPRRFHASDQWTYVYFDLPNEAWVGVTGSGNGVLEGSWGTLESLVFRPVPGSTPGEVEIYLDDFTQGPMHQVPGTGAPHGFIVR